MYNNKKKILLFVICGLIITMSIGFALLNGNFNITGTAQIGSNFDIRITNIRVKNLHSGYQSGTNASSDVSGSTGCTVNNVSGCTGTIANFDAKLITPGDYIVYEVTVTNSGTLDGVVQSISLSPTTTDSDAIQVTKSGLTDGTTIDKNGGTNTIEVRVEYNSNTSSQPSSTTTNITLTINYRQNITASNNSQQQTPSFNGTGTVYRYSVEDNYQIGDSIENEEYSTRSPGVTSLLYLKQNVVDYEITDTYACFYTDSETCVKLGDASDYDDNVAVLQAKESWFEDREGGCQDNETSYGCGADELSVDIDNNNGRITVVWHGYLDYYSDEYGITNMQMENSIVYTPATITDFQEWVETNSYGIDHYNYSIDPSTFNSNVYFKHDVDSSVIQVSYVCFVTDQEYCIGGGAGGNYPYIYSINVATLQANQSWFNSHSGSCTLQPSGSSSSCYGGGFDNIYISARSDLGYGTIARIDTDGKSCYIWDDGANNTQAGCSAQQN